MPRTAKLDLDRAEYTVELDLGGDEIYSLSSLDAARILAERRAISAGPYADTQNTAIPVLVDTFGRDVSLFIVNISGSAVSFSDYADGAKGFAVDVPVFEALARELPGVSEVVGASVYVLAYA